jgi:uncharacterized membrane protein YeaQ/YmgE (transglycosylase-associated protein family)
MQEAEIGWAAAIIVGGFAGWFAEMFMKSGTGVVTNIILGIVGAALGNWLLKRLERFPAEVNLFVQMGIP